MNKRLRFGSKFVWRDIFFLFIVALLIRLAAALPQQQPNYMDAAYSYVNALNLAAGRGFVEDFVWIYLDNPDPPPQPSHLYWMPLTSMLAWLGMVGGGISYRAAQIPFIILSALLAPIAYVVAYVLSEQRWQSWLAGLLVIFSGFYFPFWTAIDNFTPFAVAGSLALLTAWKAMKNETMNNETMHNETMKNETVNNEGMNNETMKNETVNNERMGNETVNNERMGNGQLSVVSAIWLVVAGVFVGLAHLARADGSLLLVVIILVYALRLIRHSLLNGNRSSHITNHVLDIAYNILRITFFLGLGYFLIMSPWFIRNWSVIGTPLPTAGSETVWLTNYDELFSYGRALSAQTFFAQGVSSILGGRWWALMTNLQTVLAVWGMVFLFPLALVGFWSLRHHLLTQLAGMYALLLLVAMTVVFAFPGARGGLFHSGAALLPYIDAAAVVGLDRAINWIGARRRHWDVRLARQFFGVGLVALAVMVSGLIYYQRVISGNAWNSADHLYPIIAEWVSSQNPEAMVMINNPPAYRYHGGGLSVVVPNEDIDTTLQVALRYQVNYLVLDPNHPAPLADIYDQMVMHPQLSLVKTFDGVHIFEIVQP